jgi:hypothetical protein
MTLPLFKEDHNEPVYRQGPVWSERNLTRFPLAILSRSDFQELLRRAAATGNTLSYEYTDEDGQVRRYEIRPDMKLGYPGAFDKDVLNDGSETYHRRWIPSAESFRSAFIASDIFVDSWELITHSPKNSER